MHIDPTTGLSAGALSASSLDQYRARGRSRNIVRNMQYHHHVHAVLIDDADIDHMGHVNNAVYLRWVQDAVVAHWKFRAPADAVESRLWVALRHEIAYRRPAFLTDSVIAESIAESLGGAKALFTTLIKRGDEVLTEVTSTWCCLDSTTLRPSRLPQAVVSRFLA